MLGLSPFTTVGVVLALLPWVWVAFNALLKRSYTRKSNGAPRGAQCTNSAHATYDLVIRNGTVFDGLGGAPKHVDVAINKDKVVLLARTVAGRGRREIDATGRWVMPGFLDAHTHYDVEVEGTPALEESLRHGVTTVVFGNCSLGIACAKSKSQIINLFSRVENMPAEVLQTVTKEPAWDGPAKYLEHLDTLALGPNVAVFLGHSDIRVAAMGMERALRSATSTAQEQGHMRRLLQSALDCGFLGLSVDLLPFHRMAFKEGAAPAAMEDLVGVSVPSQRAAYSEVTALASLVRRAGAILQATPNVLRLESTIMLFWASVGGCCARRPCRVTILSALDVKFNKLLGHAATAAAWFVNRVLRADVRFQALAAPFLVYCDGASTPLFEEFPTGAAAMNVEADERQKLFGDPDFRARFRRDWYKWGPRLFARDLSDMHIVASPDASHVGHTFAQLASQRGCDELDCFMDLASKHGDAVRWRVVVANHRPSQVKRILANQFTMPGFNDSGAHIRNMAFHDGALHMLRMAARDPAWMSPARAVQRLTSEPAGWMGLSVGTLEPGQVADITIVDPAALVADDATGLADEPYECHNDPRIGGSWRLLKRSGAVVTHVLVSGSVVVQDGSFGTSVGKVKTGRVLRRTPVV